MQDSNFLFLLIAIILAIFIPTYCFLPIHYTEEALLICYLIDSEI